MYPFCLFPMQYAVSVPITFDDVAPHQFLESLSPASEMGSFTVLIVPETPSPIESPSPSSSRITPPPISHLTDQSDKPDEATLLQLQIFVSFLS